MLVGVGSQAHGGSESASTSTTTLIIALSCGFGLFVACALCCYFVLPDTNGPRSQVEMLDLRDLQRREDLPDEELEDGQVEWQCLVCAHLNHPDYSSCVLCGSPATLSMMSSFYRMQTRSEAQLHSVASFCADKAVPNADGIMDELTAGSRQRALRYRRLNQRQRGAQRRHLWQRVRLPQGKFVWVRTGNDTSQSFVAKLRHRYSGLLRKSSSLSLSSKELLHQKNDQSMGFFTDIGDSGLISWKKADSWIIEVEEEGADDEEDEEEVQESADIDYEGVISMSFRDKERWFLRKLARVAVPYTESVQKLLVHRDRILSDSATQMCGRNADHQIRYHLRITFDGEPALDAGGVLREWFSLVCKELFSTETGLFRPTHAENMAYWINPHSVHAAKDHLQYFKFAGRLFGKAMLENLCFDAHLALPLLKHWLGVPISFSDLEFLDEEIYKSSCWIRDNDGVDALCLTFCVTTELGETVDLKPNGREIDVTDENKLEYLMLLLRYYMLDSVSVQLQALLSGLYEIVPRSLLSVFDYQELDFFLCGLPTINVKDWRRNTRIRYRSALVDDADGGQEEKGNEAVEKESQVVGWFWEVVEAFSDEERARLLQFATGSSRVPVEGFQALTSASGYVHPFTLRLVERGVPPTGMCPRAHTCFNRIDLPLYESREELENYLSLVIQMEITGFGLE